jgi:hypothetical protein
MTFIPPIQEADCKTILLTACAGAAASLMAAIIPEGMAHSLNIIDDSKLRLICISGSLGGAILSVGIFPPPASSGVRGLALKISCSSISGVLFSPMVMRWMNFPIQTDEVLAIAGAVALVSWSTLQMAVPLFTKIIGRKAQSYEPDNDKKP